MELKTYPLDNFSQNLLESALLVAQRISNPFTQVDALAGVAGCYSQFGQSSLGTEILAQARAAISRIQEPALKVRAMSDLAGTYEARGLQEEVNTILTEALNIATTTPDNSEAMQESLDQLAFRCQRAGKLEQALKILDGIEDPFRKESFKRHLLLSAVQDKAEAGQNEEAFHLIQDTNSEKHIPFSTSGEDAHLEASAHQVFGNNVTKVFGLSRLIHLYQDTGQSELMDRAIAEQVRISDSHRKPYISLNGRINAAQRYIEAERKDEAIELLNQAFQDLQTLTVPTDEPLPDRSNRLQILSDLAKGFALAGEDERFLQVLDAVDTIPGVQDVLSWKADTLTQVGFNLAQKGDSNKATQVLEQATELLNRLPDGEDKAKNLVLIAFAYLGANREGTALDTDREKYRAIVASAQQLSRYLDDEMQKSLAFLLKETGSIEQALEIAAANEDDEMLSTLVWNYSTTHQVNKALAVIPRIKSVGFQAEALVAIAVEYAETGHKNQALSIMHQAFELIQSASSEEPELTDLEDQQSQLAEVLKDYLDANDPETLWTLVNSIQDAETGFHILHELALELELNGCSSASTTTWLTQIIAQQWEIAQTLPDTAIDKNSQLTRDEQLAILARQFASLAQFEQALQVVASLNNSPARSRALLQIAEEYAELDRPIDDRAMRILQVIIEGLN